MIYFIYIIDNIKEIRLLSKWTDKSFDMVLHPKHTLGPLGSDSTICKLRFASNFKKQGRPQLAHASSNRKDQTNQPWT